ncbi:uncharacterized protein METZ01_LOCUS481682, partial [marine metagenome]
MKSSLSARVRSRPFGRSTRAGGYA